MTLSRGVLHDFLKKVENGDTRGAARDLNLYGNANLIADARTDVRGTVFHVMAEAEHLVGDQVLKQFEHPLLKGQVDDIVNVRDQALHRPALGTACYLGQHAPLVKRLLTLGAKPEKTDGDGNPPLVLLGKSKGRSEDTLVLMMHDLVKAGARLDTPGKSVRRVV